MGENKITSNPFRVGSKAHTFCEISNVDYTTGYSDIIYVDELQAFGLKTTNGGDWCRTDGTLGKKFNIDRRREKGRIISVQLVGYKKNVFDKSIASAIRDYYKNRPCTLLCITGNFVELDHKDGRKDCYSDDETVADYQVLHKCANDAKRSHCATCKLTGIRFDAHIMGYTVSQWIGTKEYVGSCVGCFWYDPIEFNSQISHCFKKVR
jgi:hypothetical protein